MRTRAIWSIWFLSNTSLSVYVSQMKSVARFRGNRLLSSSMRLVRRYFLYSSLIGSAAIFKLLNPVQMCVLCQSLSGMLAV